MKIPFLDKLLSNIELRLNHGDAAPAETLLTQLESRESRQAMAEVVLALFERWELHAVNQAELLGCATVKPIMQQKILPQDAGMLQRVGHLLAIGRALKALYPYAPAERDQWVRRAHEKLGGNTPLEVMLSDGLSGIRRVRDLVEMSLKDGNRL